MPGPPGRGHRGLTAAAVLALLVALTGCEPVERPRIPRLATVAPPVSWQWQLTGDLDHTVEAGIFLLDVFRTPAEDVRRLVERGRRPLCHVTVGSFSSDDPDADRFPAALIGAPARSAAGAGAAGGPPRESPAVRSPDRTERSGGRWLDIRQWSALEPVLADRFRLCRGKGFVGVAPVDVDGFTHQTGFPLTFDDQLRFNRRVADLARRIGLTPGLVNDVRQVQALEPYFDFAVNEECVRLRECAKLLPFVEAGKLVLHVEYEGSVADFCVTTLGYGFSSMRKHRDLGIWRAPCPG
jgi:hypothetical protein